MTLVYTLLIVLAAYLASCGLYQLVLAIASRTKAKCLCEFDGTQRKLLVLVPAYQEDAVIIESTRKNMSLKYLYPSSKFDYVVISDGLKEETNKALVKLGAKVHIVSFEKSTKVKSLQSAVKAYQGDYDGVVILDADNTTEMNFLFKANHYLSCGYQAIQGIRKAANAQSEIALMDGLSEAANTAMLCKGANRLGFSSKLSGSSMVFGYRLFQDTIHQMTAVGGFDKELEIAMTKMGVFIRYADDLIVNDEKVSNAQSFAKQRGRWLQSQYAFLKKSFGPALLELAKGNGDHFHKVMQLALPPRVLAPFALTILMLIGVMYNPALAIVSLAGLFSTMSSYILVLPLESIVNNIIKILKSLPALVTSTVKALRLMSVAKREFIHTEHKIAQA